MCPYQKLLKTAVSHSVVTRCDQHFANSAFPAAVFFQGCSMVGSLCELHLAIAALRRPSDQVLILRKLMEVDGKMHDCWWPCWFLYWIALGSIQNFIPVKNFSIPVLVSSANPVWFSMKRETGVKHAGRCSKFHYSNVHVITIEFTQELPGAMGSSWDHTQTSRTSQRTSQLSQPGHKEHHGVQHQICVLHPEQSTAVTAVGKT